jgi:pimeloyl-ACP methyl ester carboxylesterase
MSTLSAPGARLYYETHGSGPLMLMIAGASGSGAPFKRAADYLAARHTVVIYDRRGFSRSELDGPQDYTHRLQVDADDVRRLIEHLSDKPATVFGTSSGAIVALEVLSRHPTTVHRIVVHEPPAVKLLADGQKWINFFSEVYDLYRQSGIEPALKRFRDQAFAESDRQAIARATDPNNGEQIRANATCWFEHELRQYPTVDLNLDLLKPHADRIVLTVGQESHGYPCYRVSTELSKKLGCELVELPGGHVGQLTQPADFARELLQALTRMDTGARAQGG